MKNTLCGIVKNEGPYLLEWIAYHKAVGIDFFIIYDNLSTDNSYAILTALDRAGIIKTYRQHENDGGSPQLKAYNHCLRNHGSDTDLMTFIDADEFLAPAQHVDLKSYIGNVFEENPDMSAMAVNWKIFGSSGMAEKQPGFVIKRFQRCDWGPRVVFKTVVRPEAAQEMFIHYAELKSGRYGNELGHPVTFQDEPGGVPGRIHAASAEKLQINHYMVKSKEEFRIKRARGNANYTHDHALKYKRFDEEYFQSHDLNHAQDSSAMRHFDRTTEIYNELFEIVSAAL